MQFTHIPERCRILDQALDARTLSEIAVAERELRAWIQANPQDTGIREAFEGLSMMRDIAEEQVTERALASPVLVSRP